MSSAPTLPSGYASQSATREDIPVLAAIWRRSDEALGLRPEASDAFLDWVAQVPYVVVSRDSIVVTQGEVPVGFAIAMRDPASEGSAMHWFGVVDPDHHGRGVGGSLIGWAHDLIDERRLEEGAFEVRTMFPASDDAAHRLFEDAGYRYVRTSWDMHRSLDGDLEPGESPAGITIRTFRTGRDERTLWQVTEAAFADHFGFTHSPFESFEGEWYRTEDWNPDRALLAEHDGEVIGELAWVDAMPDGYIASVGVLPAYRGRGIAQALLRRAFADIAAAGFSSVTLSVDSENTTGAVELYRTVGMEQVREAHMFQRADA